MEQKLHPNVIRYWQVMYTFRTFKWILIGSIPLIVRAFWLPAWGWLTMISCLAIPYFLIKGLAFVCYGVHKKYSRRSYSLGDDEIMIRWGNVWSENSSIIPLSRVQHVDQEQRYARQKIGLI